MLPEPLLVVGGDPERRTQLAAVLRTAGLTVIESAHGPDAADLVRSSSPAAMVLDLSLPGLDVDLLVRSLAPDDALPPEPLEAVEVRHIRRTLEHTGGNRRQAAILLGISRSTLLHKIRKHGL